MYFFNSSGKTFQHLPSSFLAHRLMGSTCVGVLSCVVLTKREACRAKTDTLDWLSQSMEIYGDVLPRSILEEGFYYKGARVPLLGPQGIFKPKIFPEMPLSIWSASTIAPTRIQGKGSFRQEDGNDFKKLHNKSKYEVK